MISIPVFNQWINDDPANKPPLGFEVDGFKVGWKTTFHRTNLLELFQKDFPEVFTFMAEHKLEPKMEVRPTHVAPGENTHWSGWLAVLYFNFENDGDAMFFYMFYSGCEEPA